MKQHPHPDAGDIALTDVLAALSDPVRLAIVAALTGGERGSSDFDCKLANSTLSHHIRTLREAGVIRHRKDGTRCFVALRPEIEHRFPGLLASVLKFAPDLGDQAEAEAGATAEAVPEGAEPQPTSA